MLVLILLLTGSFLGLGYYSIAENVPSLFISAAIGFVLLILHNMISNRTLETLTALGVFVALIASIAIFGLSNFGST